MIIIYVKLINLSCKYHFLYIHNRCPNGDCVHQITECNLQKSICSLGLSFFFSYYSLEHPIRCWNNECVNSEDECPFSNGCSSKTPYRCYSGECVTVLIHSSLYDSLGSFQLYFSSLSKRNTISLFRWLLC